MGVTVKVNGAANSLVHKGSNGISVATLPDVCKTPSPGGPVPLPYPNISRTATLAKGTTTVKADGGNMIAIKGSEHAMSNGDEPGVAGGVKSSTFMKESTWILYSFDVKMEGKNACRLTDKKFQNHENSADLAGILQMPVRPVPPAALLKIAKCCGLAIDCHADYDKKGCTSRGRHKHSCCEDAINRKKAAGHWKNVTAEARHPKTARHPECRLDVQINAGSTGGGRITHIWDFKFNCSTTPKMSRAQQSKYFRRFKPAKIGIVGFKGRPNNISKAAKQKLCKGAQLRGSC